MLYPDPEKGLNQSCDLIARCRHRNEFKLWMTIEDNDQLTIKIGLN